MDWICLKRISKPFLYQGIGYQTAGKTMKEISSRFEVLPVDVSRLTEAVRPSLRFKFKLRKRFRRPRVLALRAFSLNVPGRPAPRGPAKGRIFFRTLTIRVRNFCQVSFEMVGSTFVL